MPDTALDLDPEFARIAAAADAAVDDVLSEDRLLADYLDAQREVLA